MGKSRILLVDNGSYEPAATLMLRKLAQEVGVLIKQEVRPVSVMHSDKIDPGQLEGRPAVIFVEAVRQAKADGIGELVVLPLFIGPSRAITEYLPEVFAKADAGAMRLTVRPTLFGDDGMELMCMLADNLRATGWKPGDGTVLLCDHGSPIVEVSRIRDALARSLREELGLSDGELVACSMERREGDEYAFNEPLLEKALTRTEGACVILMLFILPGRHAGPGGDVETIVREHAPTGLRWKLSPLLGTHPDLPALLELRYAEQPHSRPAWWKVWALIGAIVILPTAGWKYLAGFLPDSIRRSSALSLLFFMVFLMIVLVPTLALLVRGNHRQTRPKSFRD